MYDMLERIKHKGYNGSPNKTVIVREAVTENVLRHSEQIVLEEIQPAPREEYKNDSAHNANGHGATLLFLFTIVHNLNFLQHNG